MSSLKGRIRGPRKTLLGTVLDVVTGQTVRAINRKPGASTEGECQAVLFEIMQKDMQGEKVFFPYGKVILIDPNGGFTEWPHWLKITNSPDEILQLYGGMKAVSESKPNATVRFTSPTRRRGFITIGSSSADVDDYSDGQSCEYDGFDMV